ncbi:hypothetical protein [Aquamicrobium defluvii]|uniref:hypothetical protein n=1 Tax=Aquamicrobium defluvii TaxID=69279 RepID=UPI0012EBB04C|nr:hypothetical protein [Aquamicrobium defluvii]
MRYTQILGWSFALLLDALLACLISWLSGENNFLGTALFLFFVIILTPVLFSVWNFIKLWSIYPIITKPLLVRAYLALFRKNNFPADYIDIDEALLTIPQDKSVPESSRIEAAKLGGELSGIRSMRPWTFGLMTYLAANDAFSKWMTIAPVNSVRTDEN